MEHEFTCPYCGEEISMVLDLSVGRQTYIEDCEVCCKPIEISFTVEDDELGNFYAKTMTRDGRVVPLFMVVERVNRPGEASPGKKAQTLFGQIICVMLTD